MSNYFKICIAVAVLVVVAVGVSNFVDPSRTEAANAEHAEIRVGEKITYTVSFGKFTDVAYAELYAVSRGKLADREAVELHGRFKTLDFVSAAFYLVDESRTTFADAESGMPIYTSVVQNAGGLPKEFITNNLATPALGFDVVSLLYRMRLTGGNGALTLFEDGKSYLVTMQVIGSEKVKTDAGEFDTSVSSIQSDYLTERGLKEMRVNLSNDEARIPVMFRFKTAKGEFKAVAASVQLAPEPTSTPVILQSPLPTPALPRPVATATPFVDNQPLAAELAFQLGESLEYSVSSAGQPVGTIVIEAKERKLFEGRDSLLLKATATRTTQANRTFGQNDFLSAQVNPETLAPRRSEMRSSGLLSIFNQTAQFDPMSGAIVINGTTLVDSPIGTHSLLSLFYAVRSFNLKPSKDSKNPVNDTRVAVLWENQPYVFTLRPSELEVITMRGQKFPAQLISISTGNPTLDSLGMRIWLGNDERRLPLKFAIGTYEAEMVTEMR